jgi:septal ring factor EnvC (AmiA/AmiB activator)
MRFLRFAMMLVLAGVCCNGCVAYQIRDQLQATNARLDKMSGQLDQMQRELAQSNAKLDRSNHSLSVMETSMDPIRVSLRRIDDELAAFRQVMDKIDKYVPVNIKPDIPPPARQAPTEETTPQKSAGAATMPVTNPASE